MFAPLLVISAVGLLLATWFYVARLVRYDVRKPILGHWSLAGGTAALVGATVVALGGFGGDVVGTALLVLLLVAVFLAAVALLAELAWDSHLAGPTLAPIVAVLAIALLSRTVYVEPSVAAGAMRAVTVLHISATVVGFLLFIPAFVLSILFVGQSYRLKTKQLAGGRLPSLMSLEHNAWRLLYVGFPIYSVGIILGLVWQDSAHVGIRPRQVFAALSWVIYAVIIVRRLQTGWRGSRSAIAVMAAFNATLGAVILYSVR